MQVSHIKLLIKRLKTAEVSEIPLAYKLFMFGCRAIRDYHERTGFVVGFKPAGGIRTAKDACTWLILIKEELGNKWLCNNLFRIGASSLLGDIERQLYHYATGRYAASHEFALA